MNDMTQQHWYQNAVFYSLDVETFYDSNGDGIGDFPGLLQKLDYLAGLGINCIWLLPFYPSPNRDNGYDVMDYYSVDPSLGTLGDFTIFMEKANLLGIRVLIDLVVNHTSILHPWFRDARKHKDSPYRDYYIWSDEPKSFQRKNLMLKGEEDTMWSYDDAACQYYLHRFYKEQPDLNLGNPAVREEILKIMGFWLKLGVSGLRVDAAEIMIEDYGQDDVDPKELYSFFNDMRSYALSKKRDAILLAEVNGDPKKMSAFLDDGNRVQMIFNFYLNQHIFLSLVKGNANILAEAMNALPALQADNQFLNFLRHHDELNLKLLQDQDMNAVLDALAPEENMRIFGYGIRRRLATMFQGHIGMQKLAYSLLFSMPGVPMLRYGDEIGMGDDLSLNGRTSVRTPMQWSKQRNGGFSDADEKDLVHPVIRENSFGYETINVMQAQHDDSSLLSWVEKLVTTRKQVPEIGIGKLEVLLSKNKPLLIHAYASKNEKIYFIHNLSDQHINCNLIESGIEKGEVFDVFSDREFNNDTEQEMCINSYGYRWFRVEKNNA
ncbi:MAG: alpha-amylase family protein [Flavisolibacter sp.]|jgi:maltose alpha-D-glucosyltransferase/alpha-amylase|nr:alpha-amylase family protein [Flavisolibacter sp.]